MAEVIAGATFTRTLGTGRGLRRLDRVGGEFDSCTFDNLVARGGAVRGVTLRGCTVWSCSIHNLVVEDCLVEDLRTSYPGGGRKQPQILWGVVTHRVTLQGTLGGLIWNGPNAQWTDAENPAIDAQRYYGAMTDWALDIREARFRSVPSLRFGPPGHLIRRDVQTQPLVDRAAAARVLDAASDRIGIWRVALHGLLRQPWPETVVLIPAAGGPKRTFLEQLAQIELIKEIADLR
jgi:hypothetical protein